MAKKREDLEKKTLFFRTGDWEKLGAAYPGIPISIVVRSVITNFVDKIEGANSPSEFFQMPEVEL